MKICYQFFLCNGLIFFILLLLTNNTFAQPPTENLILDCSPKNMEIKFFKDKGTGKDLKIVVGRAIEFKAKPGNLQSYQWSLGANNGVDFWPLSTGATGAILAPTTKSGIAFIQNLPANNSDFGSAHGNLVLSDPAGNVTTANKTVEVFFKKDDMHSTGVPNWFFYWSQSTVIQNLLNIPGIPLYNTNTCAFDAAPKALKLTIEYAGYPYNNGNGTYGSNSFAVRGGTVTTNINLAYCNSPAQLVVTGYDPQYSKIRIGEGCGFKKRRIVGVGNDEGIHSLYRVVVHEVEHAIIECDVWQFTHPSQPTVLAGYSSLWDLDKDGYKDLWENQSVDAMPYMFSTVVPGGIADSYNPAYGQCYPLGTCSAGTMYEEDRCRMREGTVNLPHIDSDDWSFDPTGNIQGKQW